jgi:UDP-N-acetylglucosamine 1-carboxyvinyltransferase
MLRSMGAIIFTSSGREITIEGVERLSGTYTEIIGDRIEAASWACLACASDGDITIHGIQPGILGNFFSYYQQVGGGVEVKGPNSIRFFRKGDLRPAIIETDVWPGLSTDWQQPFAIILTQADGVSVIHETVYENRFGYLKDLVQLGARAQLTTACLGSLPCRYHNSDYEHSAIIIGPSRMRAAERVHVPDLRAGLGYVIAAAIAKGTTTITGISFVERGYGNIAPRLQNMNLDIERVLLEPEPASAE